MSGADLLLVDNDATIADLVAWVLERSGHRVRTARSFVEARGALAERVPDLMLSDVDLGAESALSELPRLSEAGVLPPTLVVSGFLGPAARERLGALREVLGFLDKPFDPRDLEQRVTELLAEVGERGREAPGFAPAPSSGVAPADPPAAPPPSDDEADDDGWIEIGGGGA